MKFRNMIEKLVLKVEESKKSRLRDVSTVNLFTMREREDKNHSI